MTPSMTAGHLNAPSSSAFQSITRPVPSQAISLNPVSTAGAEHDDRPGKRILPKGLSRERSQSLRTLAKVDGFRGNQDPCSRADSDHGATALRAPMTVLTNTGSAPARTRTMMPAVRISIGAAAPGAGA